jgi:hypothetical protein
MTKGQSKAKIRRRLRKRGTGENTKMLGKLTRYNYGIGPKPKNTPVLTETSTKTISKL